MLTRRGEEVRATVAIGFFVTGLALVCLGLYQGWSRQASPSVLLSTTMAARRAKQGRIMMLCEGHFLDTATGIPEEEYSTLSHPGMLEGIVAASVAMRLPPFPEAALLCMRCMDLREPEFTFSTKPWCSDGSGEHISSSSMRCHEMAQKHLSAIRGT
jgi:hypothetical protein